MFGGSLGLRGGEMWTVDRVVKDPFVVEFAAAAKLELDVMTGASSESKAKVVDTLTAVIERERPSVVDARWIAASSYCTLEGSTIALWKLLTPLVEPTGSPDWRMRFLQESETVKVWARICKDMLGSKLLPGKGGNLAVAAVEGIGLARDEAAGTPPARDWAAIFPAFQYFVRELLEKSLGLADPLGNRLLADVGSLHRSFARAYMTPMGACAYYNLPSLMRFLREEFRARLDEPDGTLTTTPLSLAVMEGKQAATKTLLELGASPTTVLPMSVGARDGRRPLICHFVVTLSIEHPFNERRKELIRLCVEKCPGSANAIHDMLGGMREDNEGGPLTAFAMALSSDVDPALVRLMMAPGGVNLTGAAKADSMNRRALLRGSPSTLEMICRDFAPFADLKTRYSKAALDEFAREMGALVGFAVEAPFSSRGKESLERLKVALKYGMTQVSGSNGDNRALEFMPQAGSEDAALAVFKLLHEGGADITCGCDGKVFIKEPKATLLHWAATFGYQKLVDFAIETLKQDVNGLCGLQGKPRRVTPLTAALSGTSSRNISLSLHLLRKYKAKVCFDGLNYVEQAMHNIILKARHSREHTKQLLEAAAANDPNMLNPKYYTRIAPDDCLGPFGLALRCQNPYAAEILLLLRLPYTSEALEHVTFMPEPMAAVGTPAQCAVLFNDWITLKALVAGGAKVTTPTSQRDAAVGGGRCMALGSVVELTTVLVRCPDRALSAMIDASARREAAEATSLSSKAKREPAAVAASDSVTNAFEDPSLSFHALPPGKEEKAKAKKRAQKKKAKAKKRAAKEGHAGAGKERGAENSDDSDTSGDDGMDAEERMLARAPVFDLEKEMQKAARSAGRGGAQGEDEDGCIIM